MLVDQLTGALFPIADDVKIQVEWNPATVAEYRLIGYETRALRREDFNNDKVDAGEIGAGTQVTAIYEVTAPGSDALLNDPLRYGTATAEGSADGELGFLRLRWKAPGEDSSDPDRNPDHRAPRKPRLKPASPPPSQASGNSCKARSTSANGAGTRPLPSPSPPAARTPMATGSKR